MRAYSLFIILFLLLGLPVQSSRAAFSDYFPPNPLIQLEESRIAIAKFEFFRHLGLIKRLPLKPGQAEQVADQAFENFRIHRADEFAKILKDKSSKKYAELTALSERAAPAVQWIHEATQLLQASALTSACQPLQAQWLEQREPSPNGLEFCDGYFESHGLTLLDVKMYVSAESSRVDSLGDQFLANPGVLKKLPITPERTEKIARQAFESFKNRRAQEVSAIKKHPSSKEFAELKGLTGTPPSAARWIGKSAQALQAAALTSGCGTLRTEWLEQRITARNGLDLCDEYFNTLGFTLFDAKVYSLEKSRVDTLDAKLAQLENDTGVPASLPVDPKDVEHLVHHYYKEFRSLRDQEFKRIASRRSSPEYARLATLDPSSTDLWVDQAIRTIQAQVREGVCARFNKTDWFNQRASASVDWSVCDEHFSRETFQFFKTGQTEALIGGLHPSAPGSPDDLSEIQEIHEIQAKRQEADCKRAINEAVMDSNTFFGPSSLGSQGKIFSQSEYRSVEHLLAEMDQQIAPIVNQLKSSIGRPRPHYRNIGSIGCPSLSQGYDPGGSSFPSGHATSGYIQGLVLAEIFPERKTEIMNRATEIGFDRVILGVHHPSDVRAGFEVAERAFEQLKATPAFRAIIEVYRVKAEALHSL